MKVFSRDVCLMLLGQAVSLAGNAALRLMLPLYLLDVTGSPALYGLSSALALAPLMLLSPLGGAAADRLPKGTLMAGLDGFTCALAAGVALALDRAPPVPLVTAALMLLGGVTGCYQPAVSASVPLLASPEGLVPVNAAVNLVSSLSALLGPVLGGALYGAWGLAAGCFLASAVMELFLRIPHRPPPPANSLPKTLKGDLRAGLSFLFREQPRLAQGAGVVCAFNLVISALLTVGLPVVVTQTLGLPAHWYGWAEGATAAGGLAGGLLAGALGERLTVRACPWLLLGCGLAAGAVGLPLALGLPPQDCYGVLAGASAAVMMLASVVTVTLLAWMQRRTPEQLTGKVTACVMALSMCAAPAGQAVYGGLFQAFPAWAVLAAGGAAACLGAVCTRRVFQEE